MYMDQFEEIPVGTSLIKSNIWLRCVDGKFIFWPPARCVSTAGLQKFKIQFTMVKKNKNFLGYTPTPKEDDKDGGI